MPPPPQQTHAHTALSPLSNADDGGDGTLLERAAAAAVQKVVVTVCTDREGGKGDTNTLNLVEPLFCSVYF